MPDFIGLLTRLVSADFRFVLVGGYAAMTHGASLMTQDIDICADFTAENLLRLNNALQGLHPIHRMTPQRLPLELTPEFCRQRGNWRMSWRRLAALR